MVILIVLTLAFVMMGFAVIFVDTDIKGEISFVCMCIAFVTWTYAIKFIDDEAVKDRLLKDKKIEWRVSKVGQPYLILKDSTLSETWKYLK